MPDFDPCDGGIDARILCLLEAPGTQAVRTTFISQDNPDPTARNMRSILAEAGVPRRWIIIWNIVPWYVGTMQKIRPVTVTSSGRKQWAS